MRIWKCQWEQSNGAIKQKYTEEKMQAYFSNDATTFLHEMKLHHAKFFCIVAAKALRLSSLHCSVFCLRQTHTEPTKTNIKINKNFLSLHTILRRVFDKSDTHGMAGPTQNLSCICVRFCVHLAAYSMLLYGVCQVSSYYIYLSIRFNRVVPRCHHSISLEWSNENSATNSNNNNSKNSVNSSSDNTTQSPS